MEWVLGHGGKAEVYLGHKPGLERSVAVKILFAHLRDDPALMKLLQAEAAALTAMKHPNILHCYDCNVVQGRPYIVMEYLEGIRLEQRFVDLHGQNLLLPLQVVDRIIASVAQALDDAHARGVVHRDIKPSSMMLVSE